MKRRLLAAQGFTNCAAPAVRSCEKKTYLNEMVHSRFVFSPRGNGMQNFRDFEAIMSGAIPLVDSEPRLSS
eukprot:10106847-Lingulodinium_polyedra.AAC.1